jgi:hypothetical protein
LTGLHVFLICTFNFCSRIRLSSCLSGMRPWVQTPVSPKMKTLEMFDSHDYVQTELVMHRKGNLEDYTHTHRHTYTHTHTHTPCLHTMGWSVAWCIDWLHVTGLLILAAFGLSAVCLEILVLLQNCLHQPPKRQSFYEPGLLSLYYRQTQVGYCHIPNVYLKERLLECLAEKTMKHLEFGHS